MPHGRDSGRQRRVGLSVDDAHVDRGLNSNLASPWRHIVTPPGRCGQIVNFGVITFGLTLLSESVDLDLRLHHCSDLCSADQQFLVLVTDPLCETDASSIDGCGEELLDCSW